MPWRERFLKVFGPGLLPGITLGDWLRLLRDNRFRVAPSCWPRAASITWQASLNSVARIWEERRFGPTIEQTQVEPPLFILGHWRSGTTWLHDLVTLDRRFAAPTTYQTMQPHTFLTTERAGARIYRWISPSRRAQDNMRLDPDSAWEDEFVMCVCGFRTPYLSWAFLKRADHYDKYLTFREAPPEALDQWRSVLMWYLKKLALKHNKPLVLKSPTHTARIRILLEMFPEARFIHIRRHPYAVFQSTLHTHEKVIPLCRLQRANPGQWTEWVLRHYREMYDAYFEERQLVPAGRLVELSFEQLEADPVSAVRSIYEELGLPSFTAAEPAVRAYVAATTAYQKNEFRPLEPALRQRVAHEWRRNFEAWGYAA